MICSICEAPRHDGERYCRACRMRGYRRGSRRSAPLKDRRDIQDIARCETNGPDPFILSAVADLGDEFAVLR